MRTRADTIFVFIGVFIFVAMGLFVVFLYTIPNFRPWGLNGVFVNNRWMTFVGDEFNHIFRQRNMIIESTNAEIFIRVRKIGFEDEARVQVFEDANGIAFNSMARTQVDFMESLDAQGVPFTRIVVREPVGAVRRTARVFINLMRDPDPEVEAALPAYNFILRTGGSPVTFSHDPDAEFMRIENLTVNGTGHVQLPGVVAPTASNPNPFRLEVGNLNIDSPNASVNLLSPIDGHTNIIGHSRNITLGNVTSMNIQGNHAVTVANASGNIDVGREDNLASGTFRVTGTNSGERIFVRASTINFNVNRANRLDLSTNGGTVIVNRLASRTVAARVRMGSGNLTLGSRADGHGVYGDIDINKTLGGMNITFANSSYATGSSLIRAHDGDINLHGTRGLVDVVIASLGNANVNVGFMDTVWLPTESSRIMVEGAREPNAAGRITVALLNNLGAQFHFRGASSIIDNITPGAGEPQNCINSDHRGPGNPSGTLEDYHVDAGCYLHRIDRGRGDGRVIHLRTQSTITINGGTF
ncbi:MAG: hypothetical protein FWC00_00840 [Firmicutes bacterium]|nr:hypothetical protein [Bacillota bacterium]